MVAALFDARYGVLVHEFKSPLKFDKTVQDYCKTLVVQGDWCFYNN